MTHNEKQQQHEEDEDEEVEVLTELCLANGLSYEKLAQEGGNVSSLEVFFSGFPRMVGLSFFPRLCQLTIVGQSVKHMEGLESCPLLSELWVVQCQLTAISGLENCVQLHKLYLYDNQICEINNLESLMELEVLWLNNNRISHIQGVSTLHSLKELNLADNTIEKIGHSLDSNVCLQDLNLSGNKINSFKELTRLTCLPRLRVLSLSDATSTPNPVCLLCNYATHVLYHMPGLHRLDSYDVSSPQVKEAAESTVMKKMMYYNMRVRTARRHLAETRVRLTERKKTLLQLPEDGVRTLSRALKNLERELSKTLSGGKKSTCRMADEPAGTSRTSDTDAGCDPAAEAKILLKVAALRERLTVRTRRLHEIEACCEEEIAHATNMAHDTVQFLLMELESVGNIRLEEGTTTDAWFNSCCDLLVSRFAPSDYSRDYGITGIKIDRVVRVLNSALRLRFEDRLHSLLNGSDAVNLLQNHRRRLEHLFYVADPERNGEKEEVLTILEEGFKTAGHYETLGKEGAVPLSNSLSVAEQPRIEHTLRQHDSKHSVDSVPFRHAQVIVSKVFVGHSTPVREGDPVDRRSHPTVTSVYRNVDARNTTATSDERPHSSNPAPECSHRRRRWFVFDRELVLPEYVVYFHYVTENHKQTVLHGQDETCNNVVLDKEVLGMEPVLKAQPKLLSLDDKILLTVARANVLSQITVLNLHGNSLSKITEISCLTSLRHLTISFNEFTRLDDISHMPNLEFLDASFNHLLTLEGLRGLGQLKDLDVRWNELTKAREDAAVLRKHAPTLLKLDARHNPWNRPTSVRMTMLGCLTTLTHLDQVMVTEEEAADAAQMAAGSKIYQASLLTHSRTSDSRPRSLRLLSTAQLLHLLRPAPWGLSQELEPDWTAKITALNLDGQRISKLVHLTKLVNLRWASFNDNSICKVEGLESCVKLEELSLDNNSISTLSGLSKLHNLNKLSVDGNRLSSLDAATVLDHLPNLTFLSVENNCISSLRGVQRVRSLLELYVGNNQISTSRDVFYLKSVTNLIILDLYGNPLVEKLENYRIYVVFHLPSLKALDGIAVEMTECESAKDMFGGRLTSDMVAEKLGHSDYTDITYLSLQSCSIRSVDLSPADLFRNLRSVNLDHNKLTSFSGLIYLPNISALCLNYNHVESILPRQRTQAHLTNRQILYSKVSSSGYGQQCPSKGNRESGPAVGLEPLMGSLEVLHLSHNGISNMANLQLSRLTNLKALFLQGNEISQVEGLEGLHQLRELALDRNRIKTLSENSFVAQSDLLELHLAENRIRELNHLDSLTALRRLFLGMNKLQDIAELEKLEVLPSLMELSVLGNPVARNSLHRLGVVLHLSQLQVLDGVTVTLEERTRAELVSADPSLCCQCSGGSLLPPTEINLPGLFPAMPKNAPLRGMTISGLQSYVHGHDVLSSNVDELGPSHYTYKHKKHRQSNPARSGQTDVTFRYIRRAGNNNNNNLPTTGHISDGSRVTYHSPEQDSRLPNGGKPPPV